MPDLKLSTIVRGDPHTIVVTVRDALGAPINLSFATWVSTVRPFRTSTRGMDLAVDTSQAAVGVLKLSLAAIDSAKLERQLVGDLQGSSFGTILSFHGHVTSDVTRSGYSTGGLVDTVTLTLGSPGTLSGAVRAVLVDSGGGLSESEVDAKITAATLPFTFNQVNAAVLWGPIPHNLGVRYPDVNVRETDDSRVIPRLEPIDDNSCYLRYVVPIAGIATFNR